MKTTELFEFRFVDREREQDILNNFFQNKQETTLWIKGDSGLGKTTFFNYVYGGWTNYALCYVNIKSDSKASEIILDFIMELQKNCDIDFFSSIKKKYKKFYNSIYKNTKDITSEIFPKLSNIVSVILDITYTAITLKNENINSIEMVNDYIHTILKNKRLCVCIDNFSRCDLETAELFFQIFKTFYSNEYFRGCIITTSEDLSDELLQAIQHQLPYTEIKIKKLDKFMHFAEILEPIFELKYFENTDLEYLYKKCSGSPKKLSTIISKLLENNGIEIGYAKKAKIQKEILINILQAEHIRFKEDDFDSAQKWIIFTYLCLSEKIKIQIVEELALYISKKILLYKAYNQETFEKELLKLIDNKIILYNVDNTLSPCHDIDYRELSDIFNNSHLKPLFAQYSYQFLSSQPDFPQKVELMCRNAREAGIYGWEKMNFHYGKFLAKNKQYYDAQKIFSLLKGVFNKMHIMQILYIAINSYETGNYELAIKQLNTIAINSLKYPKAKYLYYFYLGKSSNNIGHISKAADMLENALEFVDKESQEYVQTLNVLHMYYFEIPKKFSKSSKIFWEIHDNYKEKFPIIWANTMRGCHNFLDSDKALSVLKEATMLLEDELEKAFINTTRGFVLIRKNDIDSAEEQFKEAASTIKRLKIHEYSYAANNLAICHMIKGKYGKAKGILLEALLWNRTDYGNLVIQCHLMICLLYLKQEKDAEEYYNYLNEYIEKNQEIDIIVKRKIFMNLAIASRILKNPLRENIFLQRAGEVVKNTSSEWLYHYLIGETEKYSTSKTIDNQRKIVTFEPWFLVYAHD